MTCNNLVMHGFNQRLEPKIFDLIQRIISSESTEEEKSPIDFFRFFKVDRGGGGGGGGGGGARKRKRSCKCLALMSEHQSV